MTAYCDVFVTFHGNLPIVRVVSSPLITLIESSGIGSTDPVCSIISDSVIPYKS